MQAAHMDLGAGCMEEGTSVNLLIINLYLVISSKKRRNMPIRNYQGNHKLDDMYVNYIGLLDPLLFCLMSENALMRACQLWRELITAGGMRTGLNM